MGLPKRRTLALVPGAVDAWRAWSVVEVDGRLRLSSLTRAEIWEPGAPFVASCTRRAHEAPYRGCSCGVYAAADAQELGGLGRIASAAVGQVSLWGRVAEHSRGYRASSAYPARLRLVCVACLADGTGAPARFLDEDRSGARPRLVPLCADHAAERTLPPAAPAERRLLAEYQVEPLPDEALARIRGRRNPSHRRRWVGAGVVAAALVVIGVFLVGPRHAPSSRMLAEAPAAAVDVAPPTDGGVLPPHDRSSAGLISSPRIRVLLLTPDRFLTPRCGMLTPVDVVRVECGDHRADVFIEDVGPLGAHREGTCSPHTVAETRRGARVLCWRSLPATRPLA